MPRRNWAGFHAPWKWKIHHQPRNSSWMNYLMWLTNHGVPHVFARGPAVTNLNAQAPGLDPALFASGLALGTPNQGEPKMIQKKSAITSLVLADSASGYVHITPLRSKNQWSLMAQELLLRAGILGRSELIFRCDNDPILLQCLDMSLMPERRWDTRVHCLHIPMPMVWLKR